MAHPVFLSHSSKDARIAQYVCAALEAAGIGCWMAPRDITPGQEWSEAILSAVEANRAMVVILTRRSDVSPHVRREVERAVSREIAIVPFRLEQFELSKPTAYFLSSSQWLDAAASPTEEDLHSLASAVRTLLDREQTRARNEVYSGAVAAQGLTGPRGRGAGSVRRKTAVFGVGALGIVFCLLATATLPYWNKGDSRAGARAANASGAGIDPKPGADKLIAMVPCQVYITDPEGMHVQWQVQSQDEKALFQQPAVSVPERLEFAQGRVHRLKLSNIPGRPDTKLYPTLEIPAPNPATKKFLEHGAIPLTIDADEFDAVFNGGTVTKVVLLPTLEMRELRISGVETLVKVRLEACIDPIEEAQKRGFVLMVVRLGSIALAEADSSAQPKLRNRTSSPGIRPSEIVVRNHGNVPEGAAPYPLTSFD